MKSIKTLFVIASLCLLSCAGNASGSSPTVKSEAHDVCYSPASEMATEINSFEVAFIGFDQYNVAFVSATGSTKVNENGIAFRINEYVASPPLSLDFRLCISPYSYKAIGSPKTKYHAEHLFHPLKLC